MKHEASTKKNKVQQSSSDRSLEKIIHFRVSNNVYHMLSNKSIEQKLGVNPGLYVRKLVTEHVKMEDTKLIKKSLTNAHISLAEIQTILKFILIWMEGFTHAHYASHKEFPPNERDAIIDAAERRTRDFYNIIMSMKLGEGNTSLEKIIADIIDGQ